MLLYKAYGFYALSELDGDQERIFCQEGWCKQQSTNTKQINKN